MNLNDPEQISSIVAAAIAILGFPMIFLQLHVASQQRRDAIKLSGSQVLLAVDAVLAAYQDISRNLRPGGAWDSSTVHPTKEELPFVEPYLGVFERLWIAYSIGQIDIATIDHLYGYRIRTIWANPRLDIEKLQNKNRRSGWSMFIALTYALEAGTGTRMAGHTDVWEPPEWLAWRNRKSKLTTAVDKIKGTFQKMKDTLQKMKRTLRKINWGRKR